MTEGAVWSFVLAAVGILGIWLAGRKNLGGWALGVFAQVLWIIFAVVTQQWGFIVSALAYGAVYGWNWWKWARERRETNSWAAWDRQEKARQRRVALRFDVGGRVVLAQPSHYLFSHHNVTPNETVGTITAKSRLAADDNGFLVDWGDGQPIRCDRDELRLALAPRGPSGASRP